MPRISKVPGQDNKIEKLLQQNLELNKEIFELTKKINKYMISAQIIGVVKIILILAPIILAVMYLPPFLKEAFSGYAEMLKFDTSQFSNILNTK